MTARLASTSPQKSVSNKGGEDDVQEIYQRALKLLQDPILPVRAHGLLLLRQLVAPHSNQESKKSQTVDPALVPAILSIFLQSIQDDDSYIFLNAVQGLAGMVDTFGKDVLKGLVKEYVRGLEGLGGTNLTQQDVDTRIRIGEALSLVIRRCGNTLGAYGKLPPFEVLDEADVVMKWIYWCRHCSGSSGPLTYRPRCVRPRCHCWRSVNAHILFPSYLMPLIYLRR
jgi:hypothetical protein